jgi:hypothetical protein
MLNLAKDVDKNVSQEEAFGSGVVEGYGIVEGKKKFW